MVKKTQKLEFEKIWDNIDVNERFELISRQINVWLPYQYQNYSSFVNQPFNLLPGVVSDWLVKYYYNKPDNLLK